MVSQKIAAHMPEMNDIHDMVEEFSKIRKRLSDMDRI